MSALPDLAARRAALTAINRSLLVEAGAGSGKTSIMAGRVAVLFASGIEPKHIAAITFTEFAASELLMRIDRFASGLAGGEVPPDIVHAFPDGVSALQRANVEHACKTLDQLTCTTIHGFAQALIKPYPAEADIDPGAEIIDPIEADLAFQERYEAWLKDSLSGAIDDGVVAELVLGDEGGGLKLFAEVAQFLRRNRNARPSKAPWSDRVVKHFVAAASKLAKKLAQLNFTEPQTETACQAFTDIVKVLGKLPLETTKPSNRAFVEVINLPQHEACFTQSGNRRQLRARGKWLEAAAAAGRSRADAQKAYDCINELYESCHDALEALLSAIAAEIIARLAAEMQGLIKDWRTYKRAAALLDFDDLLYTARDLLAGREEVRQALANRFRHVLVDEFQDTDPLQIDILWLLCGEATKNSKNTAPLTRALRPGALFLVGDPKQAIYRFRGADMNAYLGARGAIGDGALLKITANFRSVEPILTFVNQRFGKVLSEAAGQPGFTKLSPTCNAVKGAPTVAALDVRIDADKPTAAMLRDAEANRVAELCSRLVGNFKVRDDRATGGRRPCQFGDIALLAPVGTELWRFEEALEDHGIPVSTQAGKGFFRRQEVQDLIALTRTLADTRDTLALGALLRGPLVGLTEGELLDIAEQLPADEERPDRLPHLDLRTDVGHVKHELARHVLEILQSLHMRFRSTTPYVLLADAIAALNVHSQLRQRFKGGAERAIANVDLFLEMSRAYDVRGMAAFARDMRANWEEAVRQVEGRPDAEQQSVALITIHVAKGLEWAIVIPINMTGTPHAESALVLDRRSNSFSIPVLGVEPTGHAALKTRDEQEHARERVRLWYVATTRARDLLVLPRHAAKLSDRCWAQMVDLGMKLLDGLEPKKLGKSVNIATDQYENAQKRPIFATEAARIAEGKTTLVWQRPSRSEAEGAPASLPLPIFESPESAENAAEISPPSIAGSSTRGIILHKLMEEVLIGETKATLADLERRALDLLAQLGVTPVKDPKFGISPSELAATIVRTLSLPEVERLRPRLIPELTIFGHQFGSEGEILTSGIADAVAPDAQGEIEVILDWKSDVDPDAKVIAHYCAQIREYRRRTGAKRALLVMMTPGKIIEAG